MVKREGFTLIELLIAIAIMGMLAGVVINAINPKKSLDEAMNVSRLHAIKQIESAMLQVLIDSKNLPSNIPANKTSAKDICQETVTGEACTVTLAGVDLSILTGTYVAHVPVDPAETGVEITGYRVYRDGSFYKACSPKIDPECGDTGGGTSSSSPSSSASQSSGGSSVASCTPTTYASTRTLTLWLDASAGTVKKTGGAVAQNGDAITTWEDTYLSQNDVTQSQSQLRPIYSNGAVVFDGADDGLSHVGNVTNFEGTTFIVFKNSGGPSEQTLISVDGGASDVGSYLSIKPGINQGGDHGLALGHRTAQQYYGANTCLPINTSTHYIAFQYEPTTAAVWMDGQSQLMQTSGSYQTLASPTGIALGTQVDNLQSTTPGATSFNGSVLEVISYTQQLSTTERQCIDTYLQNKWNIPASTAQGNLSSCVTICCGPGGCPCGNGIVEGTEQCDDGNRINGDGCSMSCRNESSSSSHSSTLSMSTSSAISMSTASIPMGTSSSSSMSTASMPMGTSSSASMFVSSMWMTPSSSSSPTVSSMMMSVSSTSSMMTASMGMSMPMMGP